MRAEIVRSLGEDSPVDELTWLIVDLIAKAPGPDHRDIEARKVGTDALLLAQFLADPNHCGERNEDGGCG